MANFMKRIIIDLDETVAFSENGNYRDAKPCCEVIAKLHSYKSMGFEIVISTSRNMRTYHGNLGKIQLNTVPIIIEWLTKHDVPCDELLTGKPWCGTHGFYVDDKAIRPNEFIAMSYDEIINLIKS